MSVQLSGGDIDWEEEGDGEGLGLLSESVNAVNVTIRSQSQRETGTSWYASVFLIVNAALGAGLLEFPWAYNAAGGVVVAIVVQAVLLFFICSALLLLAYCSDVDNSATYQDVVESMCGSVGQLACAACLTLYCFGACITYLIIIGDQLDRVFLAVAPGHHDVWYMDRKFTISVSSLVFILPLCFPRRIDFLKYASMLGVVGVVYVVILVIVEYYIGGYVPGPIKYTPDSWMDVFTVVPTICFGYQCHVSVVPIYSCMENRNLKEFGKTVTFAILICVLSYTVSAVFGYWTFGSGVQEDILVSYNPKPEVLVACIMIAAKTYTTYPILLFCGRVAFDSIWVKVWGLTAAEVAFGERRRRIITVILWFLVTVALAAFIPNIAIVINLLGGLAACFIFVFPGLCLLQLAFRKSGRISINKERTAVVLACAFVVLGAFLTGVTVCQSIADDILQHT